MCTTNPISSRPPPLFPALPPLPHPKIMTSLGRAGTVDRTGQGCGVGCVPYVTGEERCAAPPVSDRGRLERAPTAAPGLDKEENQLISFLFHVPYCPGPHRRAAPPTLTLTRPQWPNTGPTRFTERCAVGLLLPLHRKTKTQILETAINTPRVIHLIFFNYMVGN